MPRPSFSVVASTLVILVAFGAFRRYVGPHIPPPFTATSPEPADYLRSGETQVLQWRPLSATIVAEAQTAKRPIFLVLGSEASRVARTLDAEVFVDPEIVRLIGERYIPARVDLTTSPSWRSAAFPIARTGAFNDEGLQMVIFDSEGRPVASLSPSAAGVPFSREQMMGFLAGVQEIFRLSPERYPAEIARDEAATAFASAVPELPERDAALGLRTRTSRTSGLVLVPGGARLSPWSLGAIARAGEVLYSRSALIALANSPMHDPMHGGVFISLQGEPESANRRIECTKALLQNAALAEVAMRVAVATGDAEIDRFARRTRRYCQLVLEGAGGAYQISDQGRDTYSPYYSLTFRRLREKPLKTDLAMLREALGADRDPQALGRPLGSTSADLSRSVTADLETLARSRPQPPSRNNRIAAVEATALARLLEVVRLTGEGHLARTYGQMLEALDRRIDRTNMDLALRLALADAHFADFLTNGRAEGLDIAAAHVDEAIQRYGTPAGTLRSGDTLPGLGLGPDLPDLGDGFRESTAAVAVRLSDAIGKATHDSDRGKRFRSWARACASRYAPILGRDGDNPNGSVAPESAAFLAACAQVADDSWSIVRAPDPVAAASAELRLDPHRLVIPAIGAAAGTSAPAQTGPF